LLLCFTPFSRHHHSPSPFSFVFTFAHPHSPLPFSFVFSPSLTTHRVAPHLLHLRSPLTIAAPHLRRSPLTETLKFFSLSKKNPSRYSLFQAVSPPSNLVQPPSPLLLLQRRRNLSFSLRCVASVPLPLFVPVPSPVLHCSLSLILIVGIDCLNHFVFPKFVAVIQAILSAGKQLQQLNIREEENNNLRSNLLRRLILSASSDSVIANATKMLSSLNKESADQGDLTNLIIASEAQFPEVTRARKAFRMEEEQLNSLIGLYRKRLGAEFGIHECFWNYSFDRGYSLKHLNYFFVCCLLETDVKVPSNWVK
ncbi:hypothetical protein S245_049104, partial [Arachis hypogaea]